MRRLPATLALLAATVAVGTALLASTPVTATLAAERETMPPPTTTTTTTKPTTATTTTTTARLEHMISYSDDGIADVLWGEDGGNSIVTRMASLIGLTGTQPPDDPTQWGEATMSAQDVVKTHQFIQDDIPASAQDVLMTGMTEAAATAADGFQQYFGIPSGMPGSSWAIKQGWMLLVSTTVLDTTGMVGLGPTMPYAVAIMTELPAGTSWTTGTNAVTAGAAALKAAFVR